MKEPGVHFLWCAALKLIEYVCCILLDKISCMRVMDLVFAYHILFDSLPWHAVCSGPFISRVTVPNLTTNTSLLFPWIWLHGWDIYSVTAQIWEFPLEKPYMYLHGSKLFLNSSKHCGDLAYLCWYLEHADTVWLWSMETLSLQELCVVFGDPLYCHWIWKICCV